MQRDIMGMAAGWRVTGALIVAVFMLLLTGWALA